MLLAQASRPDDHKARYSNSQKSGTAISINSQKSSKKNSELHSGRPSKHQSTLSRMIQQVLASSEGEAESEFDSTGHLLTSSEKNTQVVIRQFNPIFHRDQISSLRHIICFVAMLSQSQTAFLIIKVVA